MDNSPSVLHGKRAALVTLGCKVNAYETQAIRRMLEEKGAVIVGDDERADIYVINTCSVTGIADKKSRQSVHRAMKLDDEALVIVTGCYAQAAGSSVFDGDDRVIVIGSNCKDEIIERAEAWFADQGASGEWVSDLKTDKKYMDLRIDGFSDKTRAFIKVEDGCNQFCTYCIIPYVRGRVRSRSLEDTLEEVTALAGAGYKEVVLTGIHLSSYGQEDYEKSKGFEHGPLLELVRAVSQVPGIERIRLGSLEPRIITREFAEGLAEIKEFCPQFHLSLQNGCNSVLKRMNRHYTIEEYAERVGILRDVFDRPAITTDIIAGFPGETDEEFQTSIDNLEAIGFAKMHVFRYSKRKGTPAATMKDQVPAEVSAERSDRLIDLDTFMHTRYLQFFPGEEQDVLVERVIERDGEYYARGLTTRYSEVEAYAGRFAPTPNTIVKVGIDEVADCVLHGKILVKPFDSRYN
ncbi:MAG: tRNA (N(6)-L-threonylcarbamoyladenosine(37)-C(2))-methylthiotransferase MtaB [Lachnospiraceae bacterium]|nr:tRNA (N(6)-L-threonylcarbamoyladenosine(37)-C(2))-methylthiotransferase MtaB [Lachnospiraceae bacterium]